jgi:hypothetical protein
MQRAAAACDVHVRTLRRLVAEIDEDSHTTAYVRVYMR